MVKIQQISKDITPFAGVFFANDEFNNFGLGKLIDNQLGIRNSTKDYFISVIDLVTNLLHTNYFYVLMLQRNIVILHLK